MPTKPVESITSFADMGVLVRVATKQAEKGVRDQPSRYPARDGAAILHVDARHCCREANKEGTSAVGGRFTEKSVSYLHAKPLPRFSALVPSTLVFCLLIISAPALHFQEEIEFLRRNVSYVGIIIVRTLR